MDVRKFVEILDADFYTGVPDSQLKPLCDYLMEEYGISEKHIIAANEGNCTALAAGYYLSTGKYPVVYLQNSGIGNIVNPVASLLNEKVYGIPCIFVVGWRGEPGVHDEPQHIFQGEITVRLLEDIGLRTFIVSKDTTDSELSDCMDSYRKTLSEGKSVAFIIRKGAVSSEHKTTYSNSNTMLREEIIRHITAVSGTDPIISTTGKASRELFEIREANGQGHQYDFLTVGSMGHSSSIAMGVALNKPETKVWCIDGDGAAVMHMGAMAVIGSVKPKNLVHIVINNGAHETVGGMPTAAGKINLTEIAKSCGYEKAAKAFDFDSLDALLKEAAEKKCLTFIEATCAIGARDNLGRPTTTSAENGHNFMNYLKTL